MPSKSQLIHHLEAYQTLIFHNASTHKFPEHKNAMTPSFLGPGHQTTWGRLRSVFRTCVLQHQNSKLDMEDPSPWCICSTKIRCNQEQEVSREGEAVVHGKNCKMGPRSSTTSLCFCCIRSASSLPLQESSIAFSVVVHFKSTRRTRISQSLFVVLHPQSYLPIIHHASSTLLPRLDGATCSLPSPTRV